jgi:hypothetical protein
MSDEPQYAYESTVVHLENESVRINKGEVIPPELLSYISNPHVLNPPPPEGAAKRQQSGTFIPQTAVQVPPSPAPRPDTDGGQDGDDSSTGGDLGDVETDPLSVLPDQLPAVLDALGKMNDDELTEFAEVSSIDLGRRTRATSIRGHIEDVLRGRADAAADTARLDAEGR